MFNVNGHHIRVATSLDTQYKTETSSEFLRTSHVTPRDLGPMEKRKDTSTIFHLSSFNCPQSGRVDYGMFVLEDRFLTNYE